MATEQLAVRLLSWFQGTVQYVVAFSGGVDSAVVAKAAWLANPDHTTLVTGDSPSLARQDLADAIATAEIIGARHLLLKTGETNDTAYRRNDALRCYHCKSHLFARLEEEFPAATIVTGTNLDDLDDYRPGLQAAKERKVRAPLAELGLGKTEVRLLAKGWGLPLAEKPAAPCLASRIAYGVEVTPERLQRVEAAEAYLRKLGLVEFRVRLHPGEMARIEVPNDRMDVVLSAAMSADLVGHLKSLGFRFVTLDLDGFTSGSLNQLIQITPPR